MTSAGMEVQSSALSSGASAFGAAFGPILDQAQRLDTLKGSASTTGRDYSAEGNQYHQAMAGQLQKLIEDYAQKCDWVNFNLSANAKDYETQDAASQSTLKSSGSGVI